MTLSAPAPALQRPWPWPKSSHKLAVSSLSAAGELSGLGRLAFDSLWLLVFAIPWEDAITISDFGTSARLIGVFTVVLGCLAILERGTFRRPAAGHMMMLLFVTSAAFTYLWSLYPEGTLTQTITYIQLLGLVWLIWELAPGAEHQKRLMQAYVLGTYVSGLDTISRFLSHHETGYRRYAGARLDANDLGLMMALSIPVSYCLLLQEKSRMVWVYRLQIVLAGTTVFLTASRGASLACLVALFILPLTQSNLTMRQRAAVLLTISLLLVCILVFVPSSSWERLSTVPDEFTHGTLTGRKIIWQAGWEIFREHPLIGIGANAFRVVVCRTLAEPIRLDDPDSPAPPAHNTFLSVLVEQGVTGFSAFCAMLAVLALSLRAMPPLPQKLWIVTLGVWAVGVSSLTWEMRKPTWFFFGLMLAQYGAFISKKSGLDRPTPGLATSHAKTLHFSS